MKKILFGLTLFSGLAFADPIEQYDLFLPAQQNNHMEFFAGAGVMIYPAYFDDDGNWKSLDDASVLSYYTYATSPFGLSFSMFSSLELSFRWALQELYVAYSDDDYDDVDTSGFDQPILGLKYGIQDLGLAFSIQLYLPFGSKIFVGDDPTLNTDFALIANEMWGHFHLRGAMDYLWIPENKNNIDYGNEFTFDIRPGVALGRSKTVTLELAYLFHVKNVTAYEGEDYSGTSSWAALVAPGILIQRNDFLKIEAMIPVSVDGDEGTAAGVGFVAQ
ncbi:MAG TPA: hypothetical protein VLM37_09360, partial [Fibrobacteraceae bacterium]|nr:hypothetical protein [Fibrobacteraceae bacterium]